MSADTASTSLLASAQSGLAQTLTAAQAYSAKLQTSIKEGRTLELISAETLTASQALQRASDDVREAGANVPVDKALALLASALASLSTATDRAIAFDQQHHLTDQLYGAIGSGIEQSKKAITEAQARLTAARTSVQTTAANVSATVVGTATSAASSAVAALPAPAHDTVMSAVGHLEELGHRLAAVEGDVVQGARSRIVAAAGEVRKSAAALQGVPLTEVPIVAGLEALHLARAALAAVTDVVAGNAHVLTAGVSAAIHASRDAASSAVTVATQQLQGLRGRLTSGALNLATTVATAGVDLAVRQAAALDASWGLSDKYGETVVTAAAYAGHIASDLDSKYKLADRAQGVLGAVQGLDERVAGGRGTALATAALTAGAAYVRDLASRYETARTAAVNGGGNGNSNGSANSGRSSPSEVSGAAASSPAGAAAATDKPAAAAIPQVEAPAFVAGKSAPRSEEPAAAAAAEPEGEAEGEAGSAAAEGSAQGGSGRASHGGGHKHKGKHRNH